MPKESDGLGAGCADVLEREDIADPNAASHNGGSPRRRHSGHASRRNRDRIAGARHRTAETWLILQTSESICSVSTVLNLRSSRPVLFASGASRRPVEIESFSDRLAAWTPSARRWRTSADRMGSDEVAQLASSDDPVVGDLPHF